MAEKENPDYLYIYKDRTKVYSSNKAKPRSIYIYEFSEDKKRLALIGDYSSVGDGACFIEVNENENLIAATNCGLRSIVAYQLDQSENIDGEPMPFQHDESGPYDN